MSEQKNTHLLLVGGEDDSNLHCLIETAQKKSINFTSLLVGKNNHPCLTWNINTDVMTLNGHEILPTGLFIRYDVFSSMKDPRVEVSHRAQRWYYSLLGYCLSHSGIMAFNSNASQCMGNKTAILYLAKNCGLNIPETLVSNDLQTFLPPSERNDNYVVKPIDGGDYCRMIDQVIETTELDGGVAANPAIIQNKLEQPEIRIYCIGNHLMGFYVESNSLDYREKQDAKLRRLEHIPKKEADGLLKLMNILGMNFGAADFKAEPKTGEFCFLEINSSPMFSRFDFESSGEVSEKMIEWLIS